MTLNNIINGRKEAFFIYEKNNGEVSKQYLSNAVIKGSYLQGFSRVRRAFRTYKLERILKVFSSQVSLEECLLDSLETTLSCTPIKSEQTEQSINKSGLEIVFSGFEKDKKDGLVKLAEKAGLRVRAGVTSRLDFLCIGTPTGWKKIEKATTVGALILTESQFINFVESGEIPYKNDEQDFDIIKIEKADDEKLREIINEATLTFHTFRDKRRSPALLASFVDGYALGWKFAIKEAFKDALDIRLTKTMIDGYVCEMWTQGTSYQFHRGDTFYSDRLGYDDWSEFLKLDYAVVLQVKYDIFSGYEVLATLEGEFTGDFLPSRLVTPKKFNKIPVLFESHSYDAGNAVIEILIPDSERKNLKRVRELSLTQDELIALLQSGKFWDKKDRLKPIMKDLFNDVCS